MQILSFVKTRLNTGSPVIWFSRKQSIVTQSIEEAEYVAANKTSKELVWAKSLLDELGIYCEYESDLFVDNRSAVQLCEPPSTN